MKYAFYSIYGYNPIIREGRYYNLISKNDFKQVIVTYCDLITVSSTFKIFFLKHVQNYIRIKRFKKKYKLPQDLFKRELGILTFRIENIYI